jgi:hypothetical protein
MRIKTLFKTFFILLLLAIVGIFAALLFFGVESNPLVKSGEKLSIQDMERAKQLLDKNDPRKLRAGEIKDLQITERDLNLLLLYGLSRFPYTENLKADVDLSPNSMNTRFTYPLPNNPLGSYLNVSVALSKVSNGIAFNKLKIGMLTLPGWLINPLIPYAHQYLRDLKEYRAFIDAVQTVKDFYLQEDRLTLVYEWQPDTINRLKAQGRDLLLSEEDKKRLLVYNEQLVKVSRTLEGQSTSLTKCLQPLFRLAQERTTASSDPVTENRAAILALAMYVNKRDITEIVGTGEGERPPRPRQLQVTLLDRYDLARHFILSAAITATADSGVANVLGLFKEVDDSRGGTGFSFADLAADRAGVRFAELSIGTSEQARLLQQKLSEAPKEIDFMPRIDRLPEGIMELEFKRRFQDLDSATTRMIREEIERRIAACRIYQ